MSYELRPLSLAEILDAAFRLVQTEWRTLIGLSFIMQAPLIVIAYSVPWIFDPFAQPFEQGEELAEDVLLEMGLAFGGMALVYMLLYPFVAAAVTSAVGNFYLDRRFELADAARAGAKSFVRLLGCYFVYMIALTGAMVVVIGGFALLASVGGALLGGVFEALGAVGTLIQVLLGIAIGGFAFFWLAFAMVAASLLPPIAVLESHGIIATVARAFALGGTSKWRLIGIVLSAGMIVGFPVGGAQMLIGTVPVFGTLIWALFQSVGFAFTTSVMVVLYFDFRCRAEHYDLELLAQQVEAGPGFGHG